MVYISSSCKEVGSIAVEFLDLARHCMYAHGNWGTTEYFPVLLQFAFFLFLQHVHVDTQGRIQGGGNTGHIPPPPPPDTHTPNAQAHSELISANLHS